MNSRSEIDKYYHELNSTVAQFLLLKAAIAKQSTNREAESVTTLPLKQNHSNGVQFRLVA